MNTPQYRSYTFEYTYNDFLWEIDIKATSMEDARNRLRLLAEARYVGRIVDETPAEPRRTSLR